MKMSMNSVECSFIRLFYSLIRSITTSYNTSLSLNSMILASSASYASNSFYFPGSTPFLSFPAASAIEDYGRVNVIFSPSLMTCSIITAKVPVFICKSLFFSSF